MTKAVSVGNETECGTKPTLTKELAIQILRGEVLGTNEQTHEAVFMAIKALKAEPKKGKWIDGKHMGFDGLFVWHRECSECWYERDDDDPDKDTNYCPNCGAQMERSEE